MVGGVKLGEIIGRTRLLLLFLGYTQHFNFEVQRLSGVRFWKGAACGSNGPSLPSLSLYMLLVRLRSMEFLSLNMGGWK